MHELHTDNLPEKLQEFIIKPNTLVLGDCLQAFKLIPSNSIDLIVIDPPYNIKKAEWDKWKTQESYVEWMWLIFEQCQRVLKNTGSFYFFHNDFLQIVKLQNWLNSNSNFVFKQLITWNKKFKGATNEGFLQGFNEVENLRNYQKMAEYCLFYTFQDATGLDVVKLDVNNFSTLRNYFKELQEFIGLNIKSINTKLGHRKAEHAFYWKSTQWELPLEKTYKELIEVFNIEGFSGFKTHEALRLEYEALRLEYEALRLEYEALRYTFNNLKTHHSVWNYNVAAKNGHITPKPVALIENIIKYSSNPNDIVLDCFGGSFTTAEAALRTNRQFICIEKSPAAFENGKKRLQKYLATR